MIVFYFPIHVKFLMSVSIGKVKRSQKNQYIMNKIVHLYVKIEQPKK